jgi:hypothetical protein
LIARDRTSSPGFETQNLWPLINADQRRAEEWRFSICVPLRQCAADGFRFSDHPITRSPDDPMIRSPDLGGTPSPRPNLEKSRRIPRDPHCDFRGSRSRRSPGPPDRAVFASWGGISPDAGDSPPLPYFIPGDPNTLYLRPCPRQPGFALVKCQVPSTNGCFSSTLFSMNGPRHPPGRQ